MAQRNFSNTETAPETVKNTAVYGKRNGIRLNIYLGSTLTNNGDIMIDAKVRFGKGLCSQQQDIPQLGTINCSPESNGELAIGAYIPFSRLNQCRAL